jgi:phage tail sheath gpL-like
MTTAIPPTRVSSTVGTLVSFKNLASGGFGLPQRLFVIAQGNTATTYAATKKQVFSAQSTAETYGFGSPIHLSVLQLLPPTGDGVGDIPVTVYPLLDGTTASVGTITPAGSPTAAGTYFIRMNNIDSGSFVLAASASVADATLAITTANNEALNQPTTCVDGTTVATVTAKWKGLTGDDIVVSIEGPSLGMTFGIVQPTSGATDPIIDAAVTDQFGDAWETLGVQALGNTTAALDAMSAFNEGRWDPTVTKWFVSFYGTSESNVSTAIPVPDARGTDRTNSQLVSPGSNDLPWVIASRELARIAKVANGASPASDYTRQLATGLTPGLPADQWTSAQRETAVKGGSSTIEVRDGVVTLSDTITMHHPTGDPTPAYRYVNNIVKLQNLQNDVNGVFEAVEWAGAPLVPDTQVLTNRSAKQPKMAVAALSALVNDWGEKALISDPATAIQTIVAAIDGGNPRRLNLALTVQLSGNTNIISIDLNFGFFFGG